MNFEYSKTGLTFHKTFVNYFIQSKNHDVVHVDGGVKAAFLIATYRLCQCRDLA